ncbi:unnamed protein product [Amoebophrya sp. A120]|nr:unnamed protein product [Amoebophrya sp. A120]|eukprot:GSA120T00013847001.1
MEQAKLAKFFDQKGGSSTRTSSRDKKKQGATGQADEDDVLPQFDFDLTTFTLDDAMFRLKVLGFAEKQAGFLAAKLVKKTKDLVATGKYLVSTTGTDTTAGGIGENKAEKTKTVSFLPTGGATTSSINRSSKKFIQLGLEDLEEWQDWEQHCDKQDKEKINAQALETKTVARPSQLNSDGSAGGAGVEKVALLNGLIGQVLETTDSEREQVGSKETNKLNTNIKDRRLSSTFEIDLTALSGTPNFGAKETATQLSNFLVLMPAKRRYNEKDGKKKKEVNTSAKKSLTASKRGRGERRKSPTSTPQSTSGQDSDREQDDFIYKENTGSRSKQGKRPASTTTPEQKKLDLVRDAQLALQDVGFSKLKARDLARKIAGFRREDVEDDMDLTEEEKKIAMKGLNIFTENNIEDLQDLTKALVTHKPQFFAEAMSLESQKEVQQKILSSGVDDQEFFPISLLEARCAGVVASRIQSAASPFGGVGMKKAAGNASKTMSRKKSNR